MHADSREHLAYCRQIEAATIGGLILAPAGVQVVRPSLEPADFTVPHYRVWYAVVLDREAAGLPIDQIALLGELRHRNALGPSGRYAYELATIAELVPIPSASTYYARMVVEESVRRQVAGAGVRLGQVAELPDPTDMLRAAEDCRTLVARAHSRWLRAQPLPQPVAILGETIGIDAWR